MQIGHDAAAGEGGEQVVRDHGQALLREVREERLGVATAGLDLPVLPLGEVEHPEMQLAPSGQQAGHLLAHEGPGQGGDVRARPRWNRGR